MAKQPVFDWYFRDWADALEIRFPHAWLIKEVGYSDGKASNVLTGKKKYDRNIINDVAEAMKIHPYELLMHPKDAMALRGLREDAKRIAAVDMDVENYIREPRGKPAPVEAPDRRRKAG